MGEKFGVWFYLTVVMKDGEAEFSRYCELPFVPLVGMMITFPEDSDEGETAWGNIRPQRVEYRVADDAFDIHETEGPEMWCGCNSGSDCCTLDTDRYVRGGWALEEVRRGKDRLHYHKGCWTPEDFEFLSQ